MGVVEFAVHYILFFYITLHSTFCFVHRIACTEYIMLNINDILLYNISYNIKIACVLYVDHNNLKDLAIISQDVDAFPQS